MTPDLAFECLLVSRDQQVIGTLNRLLDSLSISTKYCSNPSTALNELRGSTADLVVIDWDDDCSALELIRGIRTSELARRKTVVAVSAVDSHIPGAHFFLKKPLTTESSTQSMKVVYSSMLRDYRRHARYPLMTPVMATVDDSRVIPVTITNIGDGGIGLSSREALSIGEVLSCRLSLPDIQQTIYIEARVLWTREYGVSGCEFIRIPPSDLDVLHEWLKAKCQVKKPFLAL